MNGLHLKIRMLHIEQQKTAGRFVRRINVVLLIAGAISLLLSFLLMRTILLFTATPLYMVFIAVCAFVVAVKSKLHHWRIGLYACCLVTGISVVWLLALWGFYRPDIEVLNPTTYLPDKSFSTTVDYATIGPEWFVTSALFHCNTVYGTQCTSAQSFLGTSLDYTILYGSVLAGNVLVRKRLAVPYLIQTEDAKLRPSM